MCSAPDGYGSIERQKNFGFGDCSSTTKARVWFQNFWAAASTDRGWYAWGSMTWGSLSSCMESGTALGRKSSRCAIEEGRRA
jgi:hypothetical protein